MRCFTVYYRFNGKQYLLCKFVKKLNNSYSLFEIHVDLFLRKDDCIIFVKNSKLNCENNYFFSDLFVSEQDDKYWARRRKNNVAAKRSRDARRLKENQIAIRAGFLEKENAALRQEVADLRKELGRCKNVLAKYEARHGPL